MNSVCEGADWYSSGVLSGTMAYLKRVFEDYRVEAITIANPMYIREVRKRFPRWKSAPLYLPILTLLIKP